MLANSNNNVGLRARVLELFNSPITLSAKHSNEIQSFVTLHSGTFGPAFVSVLSEYSSDELWKMVMDEKVAFESVIEGEFLPITERLSFKYAILITVAKLVNAKMKFSLNIESLAEFLLEHHNGYRSEVNLGEHAYNTLLEWVAKNRSRLQEERGISSGIVEGTIKGTMVALLSTTFEKIMKEAGFTDIKVVAHFLKAMDVLRPEKKNGLQARVVVNGVKAPCYRFVLKDLAHYISYKSIFNEPDVSDEELNF